VDIIEPKPDFPKTASLNSTLLKFLIALDSGKQDLEKSRSSLKRVKSQPNDFPNINRWFSPTERPKKFRGSETWTKTSLVIEFSPTDGLEDDGKLLVQTNPLK
jgi:hypothetical protein